MRLNVNVGGHEKVLQGSRAAHPQVEDWIQDEGPALHQLELVELSHSLVS